MSVGHGGSALFPPCSFDTRNAFTAAASGAVLRRVSDFAACEARACMRVRVSLGRP